MGMQDAGSTPVWYTKGHHFWYLKIAQIGRGLMLSRRSGICSYELLKKKSGGILARSKGLFEIRPNRSRCETVN